MSLFSRALTVAFLALGLYHAPLSAAGAQGLSPDSNYENAPGSAAFLANPKSLLTTYPLGGGSLVSAVRSLVVADLQTLSSLLTLTLLATDDQKNALGTGIGLAALTILPSNPRAAGLIQIGVVSFNDPTLLAAFAAVTGNQRLAAAEPGTGGGGGSSGSGETSTSPATGGRGIAGTSFLDPSFATRNIVDVFVIPTFTNPGPIDPPTTTVGGSVSPTTTP